MTIRYPSRTAALLLLAPSLLLAQPAPTDGIPPPRTQLDNVKAALLGETGLIESGPDSILIIPADRSGTISAALDQFSARGVFLTDSSSATNHPDTSSLDAEPRFDFVRYEHLGYILSKLPEEFETNTDFGRLPAWLVGARIAAEAYADPSIGTHKITQVCERLTQYMRVGPSPKSLGFLVNWDENYSVESMMRTRIKGRIQYLRLGIERVLQMVRDFSPDGPGAQSLRSSFPIKVTGLVSINKEIAVTVASEEDPSGVCVSIQKPVHGIELRSGNSTQSDGVPLLFLQTAWRLPVATASSTRTVPSIELTRFVFSFGGGRFLASKDIPLSIEQIESAANSSFLSLKKLEDSLETPESSGSWLDLLMLNQQETVLQQVMSKQEVEAFAALDDAFMTLPHSPN